MMRDLMNGRPVGSPAVRHFIEAHQPDVALVDFHLRGENSYDFKLAADRILVTDADCPYRQPQ